MISQFISYKILNIYPISAQTLVYLLVRINSSAINQWLSNCYIARQWMRLPIKFPNASPHLFALDLVFARRSVQWTSAVVWCFLRLISDPFVVARLALDFVTLFALDAMLWSKYDSIDVQVLRNGHINLW